MFNEPRSIHEFNQHSLSPTSATNEYPQLPRLKPKQALRILAIHRSIMARGAQLNCSLLAGLLSNNRRTIHRDIMMMREVFGLHIEYLGYRVGYYYSRTPHFDLEEFLFDQHPDLDQILAEKLSGPSEQESELA
jgi:hypothetical protein